MIASWTCAAWIALATVRPGSVVPADTSHADDPGPSSAEASSARAALEPRPIPVPQPPPPLPAAAPPLRPAPDADAVRDRTLRLSGAALAAIPLLGEVMWWRNEETERFHFQRENWLGEGTYAGGADKVSHVFGGYVFSRELAGGYEKLGNSPARSRALATGMTLAAGMLVELGDGFSTYGYSWEDVFSDLVGAGFAAGIGAAGLDDTLGIRFGLVRTEIPPPCCRAYGYGSDYSREIYSFDVKLDGALRRLGTRPGPARFLLVSLTYGSKGYRFSPTGVRERNVGLDLGLNIVEILKAIGVREDTWWGLPLLKIFTYYRPEFTAWGWRYDVNHHKWSGFGTGGRFDPGRVIYQ